MDVDAPFPDFPFGGSVGGVIAGNLNGIVWASISDGVRTMTPDTVFLRGFGTSISEWIIGAGRYPLQPSSDSRALTTSNTGNGGGIVRGTRVSLRVRRPSNPVFYTGTGPSGTWLVVSTPEIGTGGLLMVSVSLLLLGFWRRTNPPLNRRPLGR